MPGALPRALPRLPCRTSLRNRLDTVTRGATALFELKSATLPLLALLLRSGDLSALTPAIDARFGGDPFDDDALVIDLSALPDSALPDFTALLALLRRHRLQPIAVRGATAEQRAAARAAGLLAAEALLMPRAPAPVAAPPPSPSAPAPTLIVDRPLRSGQQVYARGGDLVVLAAVSFGAEVMADGSIHIYAPLRGRAIAGALGYTAARIFSTCMQPQLVSIAGTWRTTDTPLPDDVQGRPAQVRLDGERLLFEALAS